MVLFEDGVLADYNYAKTQWEKAIDDVDITGFTADLEHSNKTLKDAFVTIESAVTEGEISNALTASTVAYQTGIKAADRIIDGQAVIAKNGFFINAALGRLGESGLKKETLLKRLGQESEDALKVRANLLEMKVLMTDIENNDGTGNTPS
jgi:predicted HNH restriction endonuclease